MRRNSAFWKLLISGAQTGTHFPVWTMRAGCDFITNLRPRPCCTKQCHPMKQINIPLLPGACDFLGKPCARQRAGLFLSAWKVKESRKRMGAINSNQAVLLGAWTWNSHLRHCAQPLGHFLVLPGSLPKTTVTCPLCVPVERCKFTMLLQPLSTMHENQALLEVDLEWVPIWNPARGSVHHRAGPPSTCGHPLPQIQASPLESPSTASDHTCKMLALLQPNGLGPEARHGVSL